MKRFHYKALPVSGPPIEGSLEGDSLSDIEAYFLRKNLTPLRVKEVRPTFKEIAKKYWNDLSFFWSRKLFENELVAFTRQFAAAYGAGLSVPQILAIVERTLSHPKLKHALHVISEKIHGGSGLSASFREFPHLFDGSYVSILESGEVSGRLDEVMGFSAGLLEKKLMHRERIRSTLLYPKLVAGAIIFTAVIMLIFVIPQFEKIYDKFGASLPLPTRVLLAVSKLVTSYGWLVGILSIAGIFGIRKLMERPSVRLWWDERVLGFPLFGPLILKAELTQFCTTFALLLRSGIKVTDATDMALKGMGNEALKKQFSPIRSVLESGGSLSGAMDQIPAVPPLLSSMVAVGEASGNLEELLERVAILFETDTEMLLKRLPTMLEPIVLGLLFALVLGLALAVYMPMWRMTSLVHGR